MKFLTAAQIVSLIVLAAGFSTQAQSETAKMYGGYYMSSTMRILPCDKINFKNYNFIFQAFLEFDENGNLLLKPGVMPSPELIKAAHQNGAKVIVSLGGGNVFRQKLFSKITSAGDSLEKYTERLVDFVVKNDYDGIDIDWEFPDSREDGARWSALIKSLRVKLDAASSKSQRKYYLTTALPTGSWAVKYADPQVIRESLDFINIMAYDMACGSNAGYHAALEKSSDDPLGREIITTFKYYEETLKVPKEKLCLGVPFYSYFYADCKPYEKITDPKRKTDRTWAQIAAMTGDWKRVYNSKSRSAWFFSQDGSRFIAADDPQSIYDKTTWALQNGYGGVFCWALHHDVMPDGSQPLTASMLKAGNDYRHGKLK